MMVRAGLGLALLGLSVGAHAQGGDLVAVHGFGGWAAGYSDNENPYGDIASNDWELDNCYFALNLGAQPAKKLSIRAQAFWGEDLRGRQLQLDYAFVEWAALPELKLRVGKVLSPLGIYTEIFDVGTVRPFYLLPQSIYGTGGTVSKSYLGAGLSGEHSLGSWEIAYDLFGGEMRFGAYEANRLVGIDPETGNMVMEPADFAPVGRYLVGGKLAVTPPLKGLEVAVSYANTELFVSIDGGPRIQEEWYTMRGGRTSLVNLSAQYETGPLKAKAEVDWKLDRGADFKHGYVEASVDVVKKLQVAASYEWHRTSLPSDSSTPLAVRESAWAHHKAAGAALDYWLSPNVVFKLNYYYVDGNFFARPLNWTQALMTGTLDDTTNVVVIGAQFSF